MLANDLIIEHLRRNYIERTDGKKYEKYGARGGEAKYPELLTDS